MLVYKCEIDKNSKETLILTVIEPEEQLPERSWTGFMKNYTDWEMTSMKINENHEKKCSIYVMKRQFLAYIKSNIAFPAGEKIKFAHLGSLLI